MKFLSPFWPIIKEQTCLITVMVTPCHQWNSPSPKSNQLVCFCFLCVYMYLNIFALKLVYYLEFIFMVVAYTIVYENIGFLLGCLLSVSVCSLCIYYNNKSWFMWLHSSENTCINYTYSFIISKPEFFQACFLQLLNCTSHVRIHHHFTWFSSAKLWVLVHIVC